MIVVGLLSATESGRPSPAAAAAMEIARRAAGAGSTVEVLGLVPGDAAWDAALFDLAQAGAGHATVARAARPSMEPADLDLALRYLPDVRALVLVRPPAQLLPTALGGADWSGATLVLIGPLDAESLGILDGTTPGAAGRSDVATPEAATPAPIVLDPPPADPDGTFAGFVAALAVRLDAGDPPEAAFRATVAALAADPA